MTNSSVNGQRDWTEIYSVNVLERSVIVSVSTAGGNYVWIC